MAGTQQASLESQDGLDDKEFFLLRLTTQPTLKLESPQTCRHLTAAVQPGAVTWRSTQERRLWPRSGHSLQPLWQAAPSRHEPLLALNVCCGWRKFPQKKEFAKIKLQICS